MIALETKWFAVTDWAGLETITCHRWRGRGGGGEGRDGSWVHLGCKLGRGLV